MPAGKYSYYLHNDDRTDMLVAGTIETVSKTYRGDFLRTAAIAGGVLYRIDCRLPALITELFDGQLQPGQTECLLAALTGQPSGVAGLQDTVVGTLPPATGQGEDEYERRRLTLQLPDNDITVSLIEAVSTRLRGQMLRQIITAGCALHTLDARLPRLLASLPAPPDNVAALKDLLTDINGGAGQVTPPVNAPAIQRPEPAAAADDGAAAVRSNMKKLF